jgi:hypothetical protein
VRIAVEITPEPTDPERSAIVAAIGRDEGGDDVRSEWLRAALREGIAADSRDESESNL